MLVGDWIWIQLCRLGGVGISARQTTARFDVGFLFLFFRSPSPPPPPPPPHSPPPLFLPDPAACLPSNPLEASATVRSGPAVMDWHPVSVKTALWLFNEAISQGGASADTGHCGFLNRKSKKKPKKQTGQVSFWGAAVAVTLPWPDCRLHKRKRKIRSTHFSLGRCNFCIPA